MAIELSSPQRRTQSPTAQHSIQYIFVLRYDEAYMKYAACCVASWRTWVTQSG